MITRTITLSSKHWQLIFDAADTYLDAGCPGEAWQTPELSAAAAALADALAQPEPQGPTLAAHGAVCTGCGIPRHEAIASIAAGSVACCPDCSTLTVLDRNAIRKWTAEPPAQPEPQGPTDEELRALWRLGWQSKDPEDGAVLFAKEVLARWGRPAIEPVPVAKRLPGPQQGK